MTGKPCAKCGQPHTGCTAHNRAGQPCRKGPVKGANVCATHGGRAPQVKAAAEQRVAEAAAEHAVATLGLPVDISPTEALLQEVQWTAGHVQWLRRKVQELYEQPTHTMTDLTDGEDLGYGNPTGVGALVWGTTKVVTGDRAGTTQEAKPSIWYALYMEERKHLTAVAAAALKAGVEERRVRLAESQGELVGSAIRAILDGLLAALIAAGLAEALRALWPQLIAEIVPRELRRIAAGDPQ